MIKRVEYDRKANAIYIYFSDKAVAHTKKLDDMRYIDYDSEDAIVGVELLHVNDAVITDNLPNRAEIERALDSRGIKAYA